MDEDGGVTTTVYTDGACLGNPGPGGWAWAVPGGRYAAWSGTSMSTPIVAGQVALLRTAYPRFDTKKLVERLIRSSDKLQQKSKFGAANLLASLWGATRAAGPAAGVDRPL